LVGDKGVFFILGVFKVFPKNSTRLPAAACPAREAASNGGQAQIRFPITLAHLSDFHVGSYYFVEDLLTQTIEEVNGLRPDVVVVTGDITSEGLQHEYELAKKYVDKLECKNLVIVPGNHDSRHVGYLHFEDLFGSRQTVLRRNGLTIVAVDSSEPDLNTGRIGRERYRWIMDSFADPDDFKIFVLHHHLLPVPGTGRERNIVYDAGDVLQILFQANVDVVLTGHKHVPYAWRLENLFIINAGTASSLRLRGRTRQCYNFMEIHESRMRVFRNYPGEKRELVVDFSAEDRSYCRWIDPTAVEMRPASAETLRTGRGRPGEALADI